MKPTNQQSTLNTGKDKTSATVKKQPTTAINQKEGATHMGSQNKWNTTIDKIGQKNQKIQGSKS